MGTLDYMRSLTVTAAPKKVYEAVTSGFANWWTDPGETLTQLGDSATFRFPPNESSWTFCALTLTPHRLVEHECIGANHMHEGLPETARTEWLGTKMRFEIEPTVNGSDITFTHIGLQPDLDCFEICQAGWDFFFLDSLKLYLNEGEGKPHA